MRSTKYQVLNAFKDIVKDSFWFQTTTSSFLPIGANEVLELKNPSAQGAMYARSQAASPATLKCYYQYDWQANLSEFNQLSLKNMKKKTLYYLVDDYQLKVKFISSTGTLDALEINVGDDEMIRLSKLSERKKSDMQEAENARLYKLFKLHLAEFIAEKLTDVFPVLANPESLKKEKITLNGIYYSGSKAVAAGAGARNISPWSYYISSPDADGDDESMITICRKAEKPKKKRKAQAPASANDQQSTESDKPNSCYLNMDQFLIFLKSKMIRNPDAKQTDKNNDILQLIQLIASDRMTLSKLVKIHDSGTAKTAEKKQQKNTADLDINVIAEIADAEQLLFSKIVENNSGYYYLRTGTEEFQKLKKQGLVRLNADPSKSGGMFSTVGGITKYEHIDKSKRLPNAMILKEQLDDSLLAYKHSKVKALCLNLQGLKKIKINSQQLVANGVFLTIDLPKFVHANYKDGYIDAIDRFYTHLLIAFINAELYKKNVGGYVDRRQSFGFLLTTATDVHESIRLSIGLVPNEMWMTCVAAGIKNFDAFITKSEQDIANARKSELHTAYSCFVTKAEEGGKSPIDSYMHHLFLDTLVKNDNVTIHDIASDVINNMPKDTAQMQLINARIVGINKALLSQEKDPSMTLYKDADETFKKYCELLVNLYSNLLNKYGHQNNIKIDLNDPALTTNEVMRKIRDELLGACQKACVTYYDQVASVDASSEEGDLDAPQQQKYFNTVCGMEALYHPAIIYKDIFSPKSPIRIFRDEYGYFELTQYMEETFTNEFFTADQNPKTAQVFYADINPCLKKLNGKQFEGNYLSAILKQLESSISDGAIVILDCTSTSREDKELISNTFNEITKKRNLSCILCLSESSLKNRGLGLEIPYGTVEMKYSEAFKAKMAAAADGNESKFVYELERLRGRSSALSKHMRRDLREALQQCDPKLLSDILSKPDAELNSACKIR